MEKSFLISAMHIIAIINAIDIKNENILLLGVLFKMQGVSQFISKFWCIVLSNCNIGKFLLLLLFIAECNEK